MRKKLRREFSAGCVVFKKIPDTSRQKPIKFLIGKHSGYKKWVLPKGLIEPGEKGWQAAIRETEEEMGVKAKLISEEPIHKEEYFFAADFKNKPDIGSQGPEARHQKPKIGERRVAVYQEQGGRKMRVFKTVSFYLAEYESGSPEDHGWEMSEAGWFTYEEAFKKMAFEGEKEALRKAIYYVAERVGFEPTVTLRLHPLSKRTH